MADSRAARVWKSRWLRAGLAALLVAFWPACGAGPSRDPEAGAANLDFVLKDMNGRDVPLADFKGRPLLINVWATWCTPCKVEIPWFVEFADTYKAQDLQVIGVSVDDSPEAIRKFAAEYKVNYTMLVGKGHDDFFALYNPESVYPYSWIIDSKGTIVAKALGVRPKEWFESHLRAMF
jgi:cytochrome c biogenesis protein CcmG/thiol:disulfide interchange protein DsbE